MTPESVRDIIDKEINGDWSVSNLHGVDLQECLLKRPLLRSFKNSWYDERLPEAASNARTIQLWLVLAEDPSADTGYSIIYDPEKSLFGLSSDGVFIGYYGTFLQTLSAM
jgi:hypothetical protein